MRTASFACWLRSLITTAASRPTRPASSAVCDRLALPLVIAWMRIARAVRWSRREVNSEAPRLPSRSSRVRFSLVLWYLLGHHAQEKAVGFLCGGLDMWRDCPGGMPM